MFDLDINDEDFDKKFKEEAKRIRGTAKKTIARAWRIQIAIWIISGLLCIGFIYALIRVLTNMGLW